MRYPPHTQVEGGEFMKAVRSAGVCVCVSVGFLSTFIVYLRGTQSSVISASRYFFLVYLKY